MNYSVGDRVEVVRGPFNTRFKECLGEQGEVLTVWPLINAMNVRLDDETELVFLWEEVEKVDNN